MQTGVPIFGICLGHQLMALASGFRTNKLKYGHRGANQPVKDLQSGKVYITSQNHGYAVVSDTIDKSIADEWFVNVNDGTCEGIIYKNAPACSVQFHPEACGGPCDTAFLFDRFMKNMEAKKNAS
jgi:carbamoyl-phosphate synthase small subunit